MHWVQQQHEKKRRKRDFPGPNLPATVFAGSTDFYQQQTSGGPLSQLTQGQAFRRLGNSVHNVFPDPLFKEQWYLVSIIKYKYNFNIISKHVLSIYHMKVFHINLINYNQISKS